MFEKNITKAILSMAMLSTIKLSAMDNFSDMKIKYNRKVIKIKTSLNDTVANLKGKIKEKTDFDSSKQHLFINNEEMSDDRFISNYYLPEDSILLLYLD